MPRKFHEREDVTLRVGFWLLNNLIRIHPMALVRYDELEDESLRGQGPSTASQTAWAAMVLQAVYGPHDRDLSRAITWLAATQLNEADAEDPVYNPDGDPAGSWVEPWFTGTGFPRVFYLRYHLYRLYFPVMAIGRYLAAHHQGEMASVVKFKPKVLVEA